MSEKTITRMENDVIQFEIYQNAISNEITRDEEEIYKMMYEIYEYNLSLSDFDLELRETDLNEYE